MSTSRNVTIWCDGSPCGASDTAPSNYTAADLRKQLRARGWRCAVRDPVHPGKLRDLCPAHARPKPCDASDPCA